MPWLLFFLWIMQSSIFFNTFSLKLVLTSFWNYLEESLFNKMKFHLIAKWAAYKYC